MIPLGDKVTPKKSRTTWLRLGKFVISIALLALLVAQASLDEIWLALQKTRLGWLSLAACSPALGIMITAKRWGRLLAIQPAPVPMAWLVESCVVAGFVRLFLPSTIGGDASRIYDCIRVGVSRGIAISSVVIDRILGLLILMVLCSIVLLFPNAIAQNYPAIYAWVGILLAGLAFLVNELFSPPDGFITSLTTQITNQLPALVARPLQKLRRSVDHYQGQTRILIAALALSTVMQLNVVTFYFLIGRALGHTIGFSVYLLVVPMAVLIMMLPISINGIGLREGAFVFLLGTYGIDAPDAIAFAWLEHGLFLAYGMMGGVVFLLRKRFHLTSTSDPGPNPLDL